MTKKHKIGIDIDNVLSNFDDELLKEFINHDKESRNTGIINKAAYITRGMFDWSEEELDDFYYSNIERIAKKLNVIEEAPKYIKQLRKKGYEIYIISGRDNGEYSNPYKMTCDWLDKYKIEYDKLILTDAYNSLEKTEICKENNVSIMIDDYYYNEYYNYYSTNIPEGLETLPDLFKRIHTFLDEIKVKYKDKNILLVTHGAVARTIQFYFEEMPEDGMLLNISGQRNCEIKEYEFIKM